MMEGECFLIVGLGNPGRKYDDTRHNIGFRIVKALGVKYGIPLRPSLIRAKGNFGKGMVQKKNVHLLLPLTFMNESGAAVKKCINYYNIPLHHLIVVTDDIALPFGKLRLRMQGSCGGHNGLWSVEKQIGTDKYSRLRIGVGNQSFEDLADYVLGRFTEEEQVQLPDIVDRAIAGIELWLSYGGKEAMQKMNM